VVGTRRALAPAQGALFAEPGTRHARALLDLRTERLLVNGQVVEVRVRRSTRARSIRLVVAPGHPLELVVARGAGADEVGRFLDEKRGWIEDKVAWARSVAQGDLLGLDRPGVAWAHGEAIPVRRANGPHARAHLRDGVLVVSGPNGRTAPAGRIAPDGGAAAAVERWYRRSALAAAAAAVERESARLSLRAGPISIRDPRSRWASCSRSGGLMFSWRLMLAPRAVFDYVAVHELCHLRHPDHSRRFWDAVARAWPTWRDERRWLDRHAFELHRYDPATALRGTDV
jgi:predicted metal-dependent hydrolase